MSPNPHLQFHAPKKEHYTTNPPPNSSISPFKINKDSHAIIKKSSSSSSSSSSTSSLGGGATATRQQRHPVIIYTHSPKIIHTNPKDFMALVQKLTGLSKSEEDDLHSKKINQNINIKQENNQDKTESRISGVSTEDNNNNNNEFRLDESSQVNSSYYPNPNPNMFHHPQNSPLFYNQHSADFYNYNPEAMYLMPGNGMRNSYSSSTLEAMKDLPDF